MTAEIIHRRGDFSPCGQFRFWNYQKHVKRSTGRRGERWIPVDRFEEVKRHSYELGELNAARRSFAKMQAQKRMEVAA